MSRGEVELVEGAEVKIADERGRGACYRVLGVREEGGEVVVELYGRKGSHRAPMLRTVAADRLRPLPAGTIRTF